MYCRQCGKEIKDDSVFCEYCGTKIVDITEQSINEQAKEHIEYNNMPSMNSKKSKGDKNLPLLIVISSAVMILITGAVIGITHLSNKNNSADSAEIVENIQDDESATEMVEDNNQVDDSAEQITEQDKEDAGVAQEENIRRAQMGDTLIVDQKSKCDGANQYDWRDDGRKIIVVSDTDYAFVNQDFITPEEINDNLNQAIGKTVGDEFTLKAMGGDGDYTFTYTIVDIPNIDVNDGYRQIMRNYLDIYYSVNSSEELDFDWLDTIEYNPEFLSGANNDSGIPVFCIEDVNGDGIQELFIAMEDKAYYKNGTSDYGWIDTVYAGYTMSNGEPVSFTGMIGNKAGTCEPCEDGVFRNYGHISGVEYGEAWEYLPPNGTELETIESIYYVGDFNDESNVTITHYKGEETMEITQEELDAIFANYPTRVLPYLSLEDYFGELYYR